MRLVKICCLFVFFAAGTSLNAGEVGTAFTYQGELQHSGEPANGTFDFVFDLFDVDSGGIALTPPLILEDIVVSEGIFTVELDFGALFTGDERWLEINVRDSDTGGYTLLFPRQAVNPAPYALFALSGGDSPWLLNGLDTYYEAGNVGIGTNNPLYPLHVISSSDERTLVVESTATTGSQNAINASVNGPGNAVVANALSPTAGSIAYRSFVAHPDGYAAYFFGGRSYFSGNVGIGEDNPLAKLHIQAEDSEAPLRIQPGSTSEHMHLVPRAGQPMGATEGDIYARDNGIIYYRSLSAWTAMNSAADFSELILPVGSGIEAHDGTAAYEGEIGFSEIISINDQGHYVRCQRPYDDRISGIESGNRGLYDLSQGSPERAAGQRQFGALGHVKLKVSAENGPIKPGDFLTCSGSQPGAGMRATRTGRVVGIAKQAFDGEQEKVGLIEVFVNPHTWLADSSTVTEAIGNDVESLRRELLVLKAENTKLWERLNDIEKLIDQDHLVMHEKARKPF